VSASSSATPARQDVDGLDLYLVIEAGIIFHSSTFLRFSYPSLVYFELIRVAFLYSHDWSAQVSIPYFPLTGD
jgi:hypothetical protein